MGIGVQGEASGEVTQHAGYSLDVHAVLQGEIAIHQTHQMLRIWR